MPSFRRLSRHFLPIGAIVIVGILCYANTFKVPFLFDDEVFIQGNPGIRSLANIGYLWSRAPNRFLTNLTFALNHQVHGFDVVGFHIVNLLIHLFCGRRDLHFSEPFSGSDRARRRGAKSGRENSGELACRARRSFIRQPSDSNRSGDVYLAAGGFSGGLPVFLESVPLPEIGLTVA